MIGTKREVQFPKRFSGSRIAAKPLLALVTPLAAALLLISCGGSGGSAVAQGESGDAAGDSGQQLEQQQGEQQQADGGARVAQAAPAESSSRAARQAAEDFQEAFRSAAEKIVPSVVEVNVTQVVNVQQRSPFDFFFGPRGDGGDGREYRRRGLGSGVVVRENGDTGYALTNAHVVSEADEIELVLDDGRSFQASVVAADERLDLALLSFPLDGESVPVATFADSSRLRVGDWVVAVGNPLGFDFTVTTGIISGLGRQPEQGALASSPTDYIQTDAAINRGNSGGALANLDGEIVGINTWIASQSGGSIGLGFAIPANVAQKAVNDFIEEGRIVYGWLGVSIGGADPSQFPNIRSDLGLGDATGALVLNVYSGSPAANGGIQPGDFITAMNGRAVSGPTDLSRRIAGLSPGERVDFTAIRFGRERTLSVDITGRPTQEQLQRGDAMWPGAIVVNISDAVRERLGIPFSVNGVLVTQVQEGSAAGNAGLQRGDVVQSVGGRGVSSMEDFYRGLAGGGRSVSVQINRGGDTRSVTLSR